MLVNSIVLPKLNLWKRNIELESHILMLLLLVGQKMRMSELPATELLEMPTELGNPIPKRNILSHVATEFELMVDLKKEFDKFKEDTSLNLSKRYPLCRYLFKEKQTLMDLLKQKDELINTLQQGKGQSAQERGTGGQSNQERDSGGQSDQERDTGGQSDRRGTRYGGIKRPRDTH